MRSPLIGVLIVQTVKRSTTTCGRPATGVINEPVRAAPAIGHGGSTNATFNGSGYLEWLLMLPEPEYLPSVILQHGGRSGIALCVPVNLRLPESGVRLGRYEVEWTPMPEAPVDKAGDPPFRERNVDRTTSVAFDRVLDAEPQAGRVEQTTDRKLRFRVPPSVCLHVAPNSLGRGPASRR